MSFFRLLFLNKKKRNSEFKKPLKFTEHDTIMNMKRNKHKDNIVIIIFVAIIITTFVPLLLIRGYIPIRAVILRCAIISSNLSCGGRSSIRTITTQILTTGGLNANRA